MEVNIKSQYICDDFHYNMLNLYESWHLERSHCLFVDNFEEILFWHSTFWTSKKIIKHKPFQPWYPVETQTKQSNDNLSKIAQSSNTATKKDQCFQ